MDKLIANITVPVDVQPGGEIEENDTRRVHNQTESVFASLPSQQYCLFSQ
jgi:hypothetical protein